LTERDLELLTNLERLELPTLSWGIVDTALSEDEVFEVIEEALNAVGDYVSAPRDVLARLIQHALVSPVAGQTQQYRTRFAEAVRLFARLRQLFPKHLRDQTWRAAPELVSDYRLLTRARRVPRRPIAPSSAIDAALERFPE